MVGGNMTLSEVFLLLRNLYKLNTIIGPSFSNSWDLETPVRSWHFLQKKQASFLDILSLVPYILSYSVSLTSLEWVFKLTGIELIFSSIIFSYLHLSQTIVLLKSELKISWIIDYYYSKFISWKSSVIFDLGFKPLITSSSGYSIYGISHLPSSQ